MLRYGTQSVIKVGLNQPIMREILRKLIEPADSDGLTESFREESAEKIQIV